MKLDHDLQPEAEHANEHVRHREHSASSVKARGTEAAITSAVPVAASVTRRNTVRLTRDLWFLELRHIDLARAVSATARTHGAASDRAATQEVQVAIAATPADVDLGFWRAVLGYDPMSDDNGVDALGHGSTVWMQEIDEAKTLRHAMHVDVSVAREHAQARLAAAVAAGGRIVDDSGAPAS